jgi:hypothetical protein
MRRRKVIVVLGMLLAAGCGKSAGGGAGSGEQSAAPAPVKKAAAKPLVVDWNERKGSLQGGQETIEVLGSKTEYSITLSKFPVGTTWEVGGKKGKVDSDIYDMVSVDVRDKLAGVALDQLKSVDVELTMKLELPDGRQGEVKLPPVYFDYGLRELFEKADGGAITFGAEPDDPKKTDCLVWPSGGELERYGKCGKVHEIDWIAVSHRLEDEKGRKVCKGYTDNAGNPMPDLTVLLKETEVVIYDRRTGDVVDKKVFPPDDECPMFTFRAKDETTQDSYPPTQKIQAWLRTKPKR